MRLINASTHKLESFGESNTPRYAILSHRWGSEAEEVSFQDMAGPDVSRATSKKGFVKIKETCIRALGHGLQYIWIDTCCIDKSSSAELTESINSMFQWYLNSAICIVYLSDLCSGGLDKDHVQRNLATCTWFTRGWTLQELIAPTYIRFYNQSWEYFGEIGDLCSKISSITKIDTDLLLGKTQLHQYSIATRMSWAANRKTERTEDLAYCLLGIFDVNMPLIYGEGHKAFRRLQEEIIKRSNDLTIFAWIPKYKQKKGTSYSLFASSADEFASSNSIRPYRNLNPMFTLTNKGLRFENFAGLEKYTVRSGEVGSQSIVYNIPVGFQRGSCAQPDFCILLQKTCPDVFIRIGNLLYDNKQRSGLWPVAPMPHFFIKTDSLNSLVFREFAHVLSLYIPKQDNLQIQAVVPESHWDENRRLFFEPEDRNWVLAVSCKLSHGESTLEVIIYIDYRSSVPRYRIASTHEYPQHSLWLFRHRLGQGLTWDDVEESYPSIMNCQSWVRIVTDGKTFVVKTLLDKGVAKSISDDEIYTLTFQTKELSPLELKKSRTSVKYAAPEQNLSTSGRN